MSDGKPQSSGVTVLGWVLALCFAAVIFGEAVATRSVFEHYKNSDKSSRRNPDYCARKNGISQTQAASVGNPADKEPAEDRQYELCQQWRSAEGTAEAAIVAWAQFFISFWGLVGVFVATYFARKTYLEAQSQAQAAWQTASITQKALEVENEPIVQFSEVENRIVPGQTSRILGGVPTDVIVVDMAVENIGGSHAQHIDLTVHLVAFRQINPLMRSLETTGVHSHNFKISHLPPSTKVAGRSVVTAVFLDIFKDIATTLLDSDSYSQVELLCVAVAKYEDRIVPDVFRVSEAHFAGVLATGKRLEWLPIDGGLHTMKKDKKERR